MKTTWKEIWNFLWKDDSWESFIASAVLVLIIGKFILIPVLGFILGTQLPIVAVVSSSMDHGVVDFNQWWEQNQDYYRTFEIDKEEFQDFKLSNGFKKGDAIVSVGADFEELQIGDVIIFQTSARREPIIHRIVEIGDGWVSTKGDNNLNQFSFEYRIPEDNIIGVAKVRAPLLGWVKVGFLELTERF